MALNKYTLHLFCDMRRPLTRKTIFDNLDIRIANVIYKTTQKTHKLTILCRIRYS